MSTPWVAEDSVQDSMKALVAQYHPRLAMIVDEIIVIFRKKSPEVGSLVIPGKTSKAPSILALLGKKDYRFIITLGEDVWKNHNSKEREALLDHHLCACGATENPQTGEMKYYVRPSDVSFYQEEVTRHGFWRNGGVHMPSPTEIEQIFGSKDDDDDATP